ncbi:oligopeptide transport system ATP-binding protein [Fervidobacterium changbaicum]|uniref:ABC transporter ATP-binding protein n=1 Tax=Fervidobacterium changbaicum TaxID=310769 RepID=UPI00088DBBDC|nr:ABC transporter ATP-binding protein [Fervidobacterium changbaicum]SDG96650.1 oligopeptide transport system ATP-binding protein [Fervidobacterium changbaicum]
METINQKAEMLENVLEVENLKVHFRTPEGIVRAVNGISFTLKKQETLALVGESGCGKSVTAQAIMGLLKSPPAIISGEIKFRSKPITETMLISSIRGKNITMVFQEPMSSFDPLYTIGYQIAEVVEKHLGIKKKDSKELIISMLRRVHIPDAERRYNEYPHQMSGGMLQRIMIALALITNPEILIADEPTTALDVTIQAQVLKLMNELKQEMKMSTIFITHDLGIVAEIADRVIVMYAGRVVERGSVYDIFESPLHPYTKGLLESKIKSAIRGRELPYIPGFVPSSTQIPEGCPFHPRCKYAMDICRKQEPGTFELGSHVVNCHLYAEENRA